MRKISAKVIKELRERPDVCQRANEGNCSGRITYEHALIYAGSQIDEAWAILKICAYHHGVDEYQDGGDMDKLKHEWIAINQATPDDLKEYPKRDWEGRRRYLNSIYGK